MGRPRAPRGQGRDRVVAAALELFSERGVSGTSLQMIADRLGVGKASVYYQFKTKDDIIQAVVAPAFEQIRHILVETEASPAPQETLVVSLVDLVIAHREVMASLSYDPAVRRFLESHGEASALILKLGQTLLGPAPAARRRIATSMFGAALSGVGVDPNLADIDDATLRRELIDLGRTLLQASAANQI